MSEPTGAAPETLVLRIIVPAHGELRAAASDVAVKIAEVLGEAPGRTAEAGAAADALASRVAANGDAEIAFAFYAAPKGLLIEARCGDRTASVRHALTRMKLPADR